MAVRGFLRILLYFAILVVAAVAAGVFYPPFLAGIEKLQTGGAGLGFEFGAIVVQTAVMLWAVRDATVRTQRRPFLTLISATRRIDFRRVVAGLVAWVIAAAVVIPISWVIGRMLAGGEGPAIPVLHGPGANWLVGLVLGLAVIPFQAGGEELLFRGWLTQTIGQFVRNPVFPALIVAFLFALAHLGAGGPLTLPYFMIGALGLSALSLGDGRLELAIGAHSAQNLFVLLVATPLLEGTDPTLFGSSSKETIGALSLAGIAVQSAIMVIVCNWPWFRSRMGIGVG